jgi:hypothetical protein
MAVISIPTSIGGVSIPGGLLNGPLGKLFNKSTGSQLLQYPSDLGSNPTRGHSVFFTIREIEPINFVEQTTAAVQNAGGTVAGVVAKPRVQNQIQASLKPPVSTIESQISLYMPDTLSMSYNSDYQEFSLTEAGGVAGKIGSAAISFYDGLKAGGWQQGAKNLMPSATELVGTLLDKSKAGTQGAADVLLRGQGQAVNPQMQLLYKGVSLRQFQLQFLFTPKDKGEADAVKNIIDTFTYHFHPSLGDASKGDQGQYFTMPSIFNIQFKFTGNDSATGSILNSILGSLGPLGTALSPSSASTGKENERLYKVGDCVLESMEVDYAPNGWAAHTDGAPVQTSLSLQFKEMNIVHRGILKKPSAGESQPEKPTIDTNLLK